MRTTGIIKVVQLTGKIDKLGWDKLVRTDFLSFILRSAISTSARQQPQTLGRLALLDASKCGASSCTKDLLMMLFVSIYCIE